MITIQNVKLFLSALTLAAKIAVNKKAKIMPGLAAVRLTVNEDGNLVTLATDLVTWQRSTLEICNPQDSAMDIAVNAKALLAVIKKLKDLGDISLGTDGNKLAIRNGRRKISLDLCEDALPTMETPAFYAVTFDKAHFSEALSFAARTISSDADYRRHLTCLHVEGRSVGARLVSTDGHRLSKVDARGESGYLNGDMDIPGGTVAAMERSIAQTNGNAPKVTLLRSDKYAGLSVGPHYVMGALESIDYPPYEKVIPSWSDVELTADVEDVRGAFDLASSIHTGTKRAALAFHPTDNTMDVSSYDTDTGEIRESLHVQYTKGQDVAPDLEVGFNVAYILDAVKGRKGAISLAFRDDTGPVSITGGMDNATALSLVMPLRP